MLNVKKFIFNPFQENTYVVYSEDKRCVIIDAGCYSQDERNEIDEFIKDHKLIPSLVINTHCHVDHIFGNPHFVENYKLDLAAHKDDEFLNESARDHALTYGLAINNISKITRYIEHNDIIKVGNDKLKVIHVPGHSPGGITFYSKESNFLIAGDVLFLGSIGRTDLPGGNYEQLISGIKNKLLVLPEETTVYCGHGDDTTISREKASNPFLI